MRLSRHSVIPASSSKNHTREPRPTPRPLLGRPWARPTCRPRNGRRTGAGSQGDSTRAGGAGWRNPWRSTRAGYRDAVELPSGSPLLAGLVSISLSGYALRRYAALWLHSYNVPDTGGSRSSPRYGAATLAAPSGHSRPKSSTLNVSIRSTPARSAARRIKASYTAAPDMLRSAIRRITVV